MIRAGGLVLYLLVLLADRLSRLCRRLLGRRAELFLARVMAAALRRAVLYPLAKHATRRSHRLFERRQLAAPSSARPSEAEIAMSRDAYRSFDTLSIDGATGILQATGSTPELYTTPMNNNDIWGGFGYDTAIEESGALARAYWMGNHRRSPLHPYVAGLITAWQAKTNVEVVRVLDIGTGTCTSIVAIATYFPASALLFGCDISPRILQLGKERLAGTSVRSFLCIADGMDLPYRDDYFDVVVNFGSINQLPDPRQGLSEMLRVAKPGALCICRDEARFEVSTGSAFRSKWFDWLLASERNHIPIEHLPDSVRGGAKSELIDELNFVLSFEKAIEAGEAP